MFRSVSRKQGRADRKRSGSHLFETDLGGSFTEALSADVHAVLSTRERMEAESRGEARDYRLSRRKIT